MIVYELGSISIVKNISETKLLRRLFVLSTCLALGGCVGGGNSTIPDTFTLSELSNIDNVGSNSRRQVLITEPVALKTIDSEQVVVRTSPSALQYLSGAQWNDRLPKVFQTKLARAYENSGIVGGVGLPGEGLAIDYQIVTSIRAFEINVSTPQSAIVTVSVKILNDRNGVVRARKIFTSSVVANGKTNAAYISALDLASTAVTGDIVSWSKRYVK